MPAAQPPIPVPDPASRSAAATPREIATAWGLFAVWAFAIQTLGGNEFSAGETSRFLGPLLRWLFPEAGPDLLEGAQFAIRKLAHVVEYALLGWLAWRAWRASFRWPPVHAAAASLALVLAVAIVDEARQAFAPDREGSVADVVLDGFGGALGLVATRGVERWLRR